jgi:hypothetical protein
VFSFENLQAVISIHHKNNNLLPGNITLITPDPDDHAKDQLFIGQHQFYGKNGPIYLAGY